MASLVDYYLQELITIIAAVITAAATIMENLVTIVDTTAIKPVTTDQTWASYLKALVRDIMLKPISFGETQRFTKDSKSSAYYQPHFPGAYP